jgi:hypothetical protein
MVLGIDDELTQGPSTISKSSRGTDSIELQQARICRMETIAETHIKAGSSQTTDRDQAPATQMNRSPESGRDDTVPGDRDGTIDAMTRRDRILPQRRQAGARTTIVPRQDRTPWKRGPLTSTHPTPEEMTVPRESNQMRGAAEQTHVKTRLQEAAQIYCPATTIFSTSHAQFRAAIPKCKPYHVRNYFGFAQLLQR